MHFARAGEEELLARVGMVEALGGKVLVQFSLERDGIFREEEAVYIETERNRRATQLVDSVEWLQAAG
jgi:hypothetical protein